MAIRALIALAALAVALTALPAAAEARGCASARATTAHASKRQIVRATLCELNHIRGRYRLHHLRLNKKLSRAARRHARDMARRNYFSHDTLGGGSFLDRIRRTGYLRGAHSWIVGENLAWGSKGYCRPWVIMRMWMHSPGHRANILNGAFREIGIGVAYDAPVRGAGHPAGTYATDFGAKR
jgi:uncharacterized protein YkwD